MKTGFRRRSESNVQVYVDIGDPYPGRAEFIEYFDFANPALQTPTIKSWGGNNYGQLGLGNTANTSSPTPVGALANWKQVSAGALHSAAIKYDGTLWAWGNNSFGQLGDSSITNRSSPVQIGTRTDWKQVSCGYTHTVAITEDGNLWAWGSNLYSQLAATSLPIKYSSIVVTGSSNWTVPLDWNNSNNTIACIGAGGGGAAAGGGGGAYAAIVNISLISGTVYTANVGVGGTGGGWVNSQLVRTSNPGGNTWLGGTSFQTSLVGAVGGNGVTYNALLNQLTPGAGGSATLSRGNIKYSGGSGGTTPYGQNGSGNYGGGGGGGAGGPFGNGAGGGTPSGPVGYFTPGGGGGGNGGGLAGGGTIFGDTVGGRGGNGRISSTTYGPSAAPETAGSQGGGGGGANGGSTTYSNGRSGGAGIDISGTIGSGGGGGGGSGPRDIYNVGGAGGQGGLYGGGGGGEGISQGAPGTLPAGAGANGAIVISYESRWASSPIQVGTSNAWIQVSAGGYHSLAISNDYRTWAWGLSANGQCASASVTVTSPALVTDNNGELLYSQSVAAGWLHSLAVSTNNELYAWGDNTYGQLGSGNNSQLNKANKITAYSNWQSVSSHGVSSGGILSDGSLYVWGYNGNYNLGLGDLANKNTPQKLGNSNWQEISMGLYHSVGMRIDGSLWTWGYNANGELGNSSYTVAAGASTPVQMSTLTNWKRATAGGNPIDTLWPTNGNVNISPQGFTLSIAVATDF